MVSVASTIHNCCKLTGERKQLSTYLSIIVFMSNTLAMNSAANLQKETGCLLGTRTMMSINSLTAVGLVVYCGVITDRTAAATGSCHGNVLNQM